eukprot:Nk52_evm69s212 gene=Nk52_evmTU69s212
MDQEALFQDLDSFDANKRSQALETLKCSVQNNNGQLLCGNIKKLFSLLKARLTDTNWSVRHQCVQCMGEIIPEFGPDLIGAISLVLPTLVINLGDPKVVIRKATQQVLQLYIKYSHNTEGVISALIKYGFANNDVRIRCETAGSIASLFSGDNLKDIDLSKPVEALVGRLRDVSDDVVGAALQALEYIRDTAGESSFEVCLDRLPDVQRQLYGTISRNSNNMSNMMSIHGSSGNDNSNNIDKNGSHQDGINSSNKNTTPNTGNGKVHNNHSDHSHNGHDDKQDYNLQGQQNGDDQHQHQHQLGGMNVGRGSSKGLGKSIPVNEIVYQLSEEQSSTETGAFLHNTRQRSLVCEKVDCELGILPSGLLSQLRDTTDWKARSLAVEKLQKIVNKLEDVRNVKKYVKGLLDLLGALLDDANFKIILTALQVIGDLVSKIGITVKPHLNFIVPKLVQKFGDNKMVIRQANMKVLNRLMHILSPKPVIAMLLPCLANQNWHVREEVVNVLISSTLTYEVHELDYEVIVSELLRRVLYDGRQRVKQVALEGLAVFNQKLGHKKMMSVLNSAMIDVKTNRSPFPGGDNFASSAGLGLHGIGVQADQSSTTLGPSKVTLDPTLLKQLEARFSIRQLPILNHDGLIEHIAGLSRGTNGTPTAMNRSSTTMASHPGEVDIEASTDFGTATPTRRFWSAGRSSSRSKLPWEKSNSAGTTGMNGSASTVDLVQMGNLEPEVPLVPREVFNFPGRSGGRRNSGNGEDKAGEKLNEPKIKPQKVSIAAGGMDVKSQNVSSPEWVGSGKPASEEKPPVKFSKHVSKAVASPSKNPIAELLNQGSYAEMFNARRAAKSNNSSPREKEAAVLKSNEQPEFVATTPGKHRASGGEKSNSSEMRSPKHPGLEKTSSGQEGGEPRYNYQTKYKPDMMDESKYFPSFGKQQGVGSVSQSWAHNPFPSQSKPQKASSRDDIPEEAVEFLKATWKKKGPETSTKEENETKATEGVSVKPAKVRLSSSARKSQSFAASADNENSSIGGSGESILENNKSLEQKHRLSDLSLEEQKVIATMEQKEIEKPQYIFSKSTREHMKQRLIKSSSEKKLNRSISENFAHSSDHIYDTFNDGAIKNAQKPKASSNTNIYSESTPSRNPASMSGVYGEQLSIGVRDSAEFEQIKAPKKSSTKRRSVIETVGNNALLEVSKERSEPLQKPETSLKSVLETFSTPGVIWSQEVDAINTVRSLIFHHKKILVSGLHDVVLGLMGAVDSLRSSVSKNAIVCIGDLYEELGTSMDQEVEATGIALLKKSADMSSSFITKEIEDSLTKMMKYTSKGKVVQVLYTGAGHKSIHVRRTSSKILAGLSAHLGNNIFHNTKDCERFFNAMVILNDEGSGETRYYAKKCLFELMRFPEMESMIRKYIPDSKQKRIRDIMDALRAKGLGDLPQVATKSGSRPNLKRNSNQNLNMTDPGLKGQGTEEAGEEKEKVSARVRRRSSFTNGNYGTASKLGKEPDALQDVPEICSELTSNDWNQRYSAIEKMVDIIRHHTEFIPKHLLKIFDSFIPRLQDSNSKVNYLALQAMEFIVHLLKDDLIPVLKNVVPAVAQCLASKVTNIRHKARDIIQGMVEHIDVVALASLFGNVAVYGSPRIRAEMVEKLSLLVEPLYSKKSVVIVKSIMPVAFQYLSEGKSDIRAANAKLLQKLYSVFGQQMYDHAGHMSDQTMQQLQDIIAA